MIKIIECCVVFRLNQLKEYIVPQAKIDILIYMLYAGLDLGTYLCRFIVAKRNMKMLHKFDIIKSEIVVVNFGVMEPGKPISAGALMRLEKAFKKFEPSFSKENLKVRCVATAAMRFSPMAEEIVEMIYQKFGIVIEIISPKEEVYLSALGCHRHIKKEALVIDVGSGSTEIAYMVRIGDRVEIKDYVSLNLGLINNLVSSLKRKDEFDKLDEFIKKYSNVTVVCSKCNTLKIAYNHFYRKNCQSVDGRKFYISSLKQSVMNFYMIRNDDLKIMPGIGAQKIKLIKLGLPWIYEVLNHIGCKEFVLSEYGLKEGIVMNLIEEDLDFKQKLHEFYE